MTDAAAATAHDGSGDDFDVVIVGGGPAGCATALALARLGRFRVLMVEAGHYRTPRVGESIPPDTRLVLQDLGVWEDFVKQDHEPCLGSCSCWGTDALGYNDFLFNPQGYGWHLDRTRFDAFLAGKVRERSGTVRLGTRFESCSRAGDGFRLRLGGDNGRRDVAARFVVDASGIRSCLSRRMGAGRRFLDRLICVTAWFEQSGSAAFSRLTMLEAVEYGWWYAAKLPDNRLAVAVASDAGIIRQNGLRSRDGFLAHLARTRHISAEVAGWRFVDGSQMTSAAPSFFLDEVTGAGWLAVGDAASAYDPISSQGIYKALSDGVRAGHAIAASLGGSEVMLGEYQASMGARFQHYMDGRNFFYGLERRWPASFFWMTRHARTALSAAAQS